LTEHANFTTLKKVVPAAWRRYGLVALSLLTATILTFVLRPVLGPQVHYLTFTLGVIASAWYGGLLPGLAATVGGFVSADFFFIEPLYSIFPVAGEDFALLTAVGVSISVLTERLSRAKTQLAVATRAAGVGIFEWKIAKDRGRWLTDPAYGLPGRQVHPDDRARVARELQDATLNRKPELVQEFRMIGPGGEVSWIEARTRFFYDRHGDPLRGVGATINTTERRLREQERERLMLEADEARSALAASNEDLQRFAYAASHDLQQPLRTIRSFTELLLRRAGPSLDTESRNIAAWIVKGADQMQKMVEGLLRFCRASDGPAEAESAVDSDVVLRRALDHLSTAIRKSTAVISSGRLPTVLMNEEQLLQIFLNLLGNALKYRGTAAPLIRVSAVENDGQWTFSISDNGIGIDPKYHDRIFGAFQRLHGMTEYEGVGLGLALVRRVVERYGGKIWVESEPGKGSTFSFTVPKATESVSTV
jgi:signal transduction histidine kinase